MGKKFKVLGVGLQKSGTSTLRECLRALGHDVARLHKNVYYDARAGHVNAITPVLDAHDAFTGLAPPYLYQIAYDRFGESLRAVLTTRRTPEIWLKSLTSHMQRRSVLGNKINRDIYGYLYPSGNERAFIDYYETHNQAVRDFFAERNASDQLLEICWETGGGWEQLCDFLGEPPPDGGIPHSNRTADLARKPIRIFLNRILMRGYRTIVGGRRP